MQRQSRSSMRLTLAGLITLSLAAFTAYLIRLEGDARPVMSEIAVDLFPQVELVEVPQLSPIEPAEPDNLPSLSSEFAVQTARLAAEGGFAGVELPAFAGPDATDGSGEANAIDAAATPRMRVPPNYPIRALDRGLEGYCQIAFDVGPDGTPINVSVSYCSRAIFERNSVRAVQQWRYSSQIRDGLAVTQTGLRTRIEYSLDEQG